jgi:CHAT domain
MVYLNSTHARVMIFLSLVHQCIPDSSAAVRATFNLILRRKAIGAEAFAVQRNAVLGNRYPELKLKLQELSTLRMQIAQKTLAGPGSEDPKTYCQQLAVWHAQKEWLEAELMHQIPEMNLEQQLRAADCQAVASILPKGVVLVEFFRFYVVDFQTVRQAVQALSSGVKLGLKPHYLAFILPAGEPDNLHMIDLGEAELIDRLIATFRAAITGEAESRGRRGLGALPSEPVSETSPTDGTKLRKDLFDKLLPAIGNRKRLLLAPDGDLTRLPFEVLPTDDGRRLIDDYQISYLGTGRDVLRFGAASSGQPAEPLVAADPDFDLSAAVGQTSANSTATPGRRSRDLDHSELHFDRLPGTRVEGERIAETLNVQAWLSDQALEARLKAYRSPRILHLATHGFFLQDQPRDPNKELRDLGAMGWQAGGDFGRMSGPGMENPLLRSGLGLTPSLSTAICRQRPKTAFSRPRMFRGWICWRRNWWCCRPVRRAWAKSTSARASSDCDGRSYWPEPRRW